MRERMVSVIWLKGVAEVLQASDLDVPALFEQAGIDIRILDNSDAHCTTEQVSMLWELAVAHSGNPAIGLTIPRVLTPGRFGMVAYVMVSCPDLLSALRHLVRYQHSVNKTVTVALVEDKEGYWLTLDLFGGARPAARQRYDHSIVIFLALCRWICGRNLRPLALDLAHPAPANLQPYHNALHCPLRFDAPVYRMLLSLADLTAPLPGSNPVLAALHDRYACENLECTDHTKISYKTRALIARGLPEGDPQRAKIARALCMGEWTLQRRLREEGTSFQQLVDETRRCLAAEYLGQSHLTLEQVAYLLGFANQSTFCRASKRWFDMSPGQYRNRSDKTRAPVPRDGTTQ